MADGPLNRINGMEIWKQWTVILSVVSVSFMAGMNVTGVVHTFNKDIHQTAEEKREMMTEEVGPVRERLSSVATTQAVIQAERSRHENEAARQFLELARQLEALRATQQEILKELRKR